MTVAELIENLQSYRNKDALVVLAGINPNKAKWDEVKNIGTLPDGRCLID